MPTGRPAGYFEVKKEYKAFPVRGASSLGPRPSGFIGDRELVSGGVAEVANEIAQYYAHAAELGGRIVASHTLRCHLSPFELRGEDAREGDAEYLFLVAEMPIQEGDTDT